MTQEGAAFLDHLESQGIRSEGFASCCQYHAASCCRATSSGCTRIPASETGGIETLFLGQYTFSPSIIAYCPWDKP
jgi:hypothetical protein